MDDLSGGNSRDFRVAQGVSGCSLGDKASYRVIHLRRKILFGYDFLFGDRRESVLVSKCSYIL